MEPNRLGGGGAGWKWGLLAAALAAVVLAGGSQLLHPEGPMPPSQAEPLPVLGEAPLFQLTTQENKSFDSRALQGKVWVADFIFTSCAGTCPELTRQMRRLQKTLPSEIQFVSISVDPRRDTPAKLSSYAKQFQVDPKNWSFLTGRQAEIEQLIQQGFRLILAEGASPQEPIAHSVRFVLVDGKGQIRGMCVGTDPQDLARLAQDAQVLLKEAG